MILYRVFYGILPFAILISASSGDRSAAFQECLSRCVTRVCRGPDATSAFSLALQLTQWTCTDDCKYHCMHMLTDIAIVEQARAQQQGLPPHSTARIQQFYGKWPFWRYAGMQEPASVVFSLMNLVAHAAGMQRVLRDIPEYFHMRPFYLAWSMLAMNAWVWSSVFHTRGTFSRLGSQQLTQIFETDTPTTEKLDYFSAGLVILYSLFFTVVRLFHLYPLGPNPRPNSVYKFWAGLCALLYISHISYLTLLPRFDYAYNMAANLIVGLLHNGLWLLYAWGPIRRFPGRDKQYHPRFASRAAVFVLLTTLATTLELFDFPPWHRIIDAHALWHLATVPIVPLWYDFLIKDALDSGWRALKL